MDHRLATLGERRWAARWRRLLGSVLVVFLWRQALPAVHAAVAAPLLERRTTIVLEGQTLGAALTRVSATLDVPLWIDRRVDAGAAASLTARDETIGGILASLGKPQQLATKEVAGVVYFGPASTADQIATLVTLARQKLNSLPAARRSAWVAPQPASWPALSEPRRLAEEQAASAGTSLDEPAAIPHDLWPARELPPMAAIDRLTLMLAGFDLTPEFSRDGSKVSARPIRSPVEIVRLYGGSGGQANAVRAAIDVETAAGGKPRVARRGGRLEVAARWEVHERIAAHLDSRPNGANSAQPSGPAPGGQQVFTLTIQAKPLGPVLEQLSRQIGFEVAWDEGVGKAQPQAAAELVSCRVERATLDELLTALLEPVGLTHAREDARVTIRAK